ncbi:hypothetical protein F2Q68_00009214 [Brassica cretica]|uniref:Uncharacterized protein n=1 Tax=Brassica cretica TaxID=69181 RepID=A0A8S9L1N9_BRACR|nr:hypothetical protein F2Q68_00009214 [Brassica cretica]
MELARTGQSSCTCIPYNCHKKMYLGPQFFQTQMGEKNAISLTPVSTKTDGWSSTALAELLKDTWIESKTNLLWQSDPRRLFYTSKQCKVKTSKSKKFPDEEYADQRSKIKKVRVKTQQQRRIVHQNLMLVTFIKAGKPD